MTQLFNQLQRGDGIHVTFGSHGSQLAMVYGRSKAGAVYALKYRAKSKKWTKPVRIYVSEVIKRSREFEHAKAAPIPVALWLGK